MVDQNSKVKEGVEEIMEKQYDPTANTKPYILASFGSAWVCMRVSRMFIKLIKLINGHLCLHLPKAKCQMFL